MTTAQSPALNPFPVPAAQQGGTSARSIATRVGELAVLVLVTLPLALALNLMALVLGGLLYSLIG